MASKMAKTTVAKSNETVLWVYYYISLSWRLLHNCYMHDCEMLMKTHALLSHSGFLLTLVSYQEQQKIYDQFLDSWKSRKYTSLREIE